MNLVLCCIDDSLADAWRHDFENVPDVRIITGDICEVDCDAIVSPANSFGFMDGGLDRALSEHFGWDLERRVQDLIAQRPMRELLVGEALVIATEDSRIPWLICAPTMRVPMRIRTTVNAYLAMKAILTAARTHNEEIPIQTIAVPGLGTGVGQLAPNLASAQMAQAYREVILGEHRYPDNFADAQKMHLTLNRTGMIYD